jgi:hypothetical protein
MFALACWIVGVCVVLRVIAIFKKGRDKNADMNTS